MLKLFSQSSKARKLQVLNATSSSGKCSLGETITLGRAPNESLCLYEPLFPIDGPSLIHKKAAFVRQEEKTHLETQRQVPEWSGWHGSTVRIQLYLPHTAAWTALKCLQGQTLLLSASVPYACKLCSGVFLLELKFGYGTSSSSSCFPSHQHSPH